MLKVLSIVVLISLVAVTSCSNGETTKVPEDTPVLTYTIEPTPTPVSTGALEPTPTPTATPEPKATQAPVATAVTAANPELEPQGRGQLEAGQISPLPLDDPMSIDSQLATAELDCLLEVAGTDWLPQLFASAEEASPEGQVQIINCLKDETLTRLYLAGPIGGMASLSIETSTCIRSGMETVDLRSVMMAGSTGDEQVYMVGGLSALFITLWCLNEEEFAAVGPAMDMTLKDRESLQCLMDLQGGPKGLAINLASVEEKEVLNVLVGAATECGLSIGARP